MNATSAGAGIAIGGEFILEVFKAGEVGRDGGGALGNGGKVMVELENTAALLCKNLS